MEATIKTLDYTIGGVPISRGVLRRGVLVTGGVGTGKSLVARDLIGQALAKGASVVVLDRFGEHATRFYEEGRDTVMDWEDGPVESANWVLATPKIKGERVLFALDAVVIEGALEAVIRLPQFVPQNGLWIVLDGFDGSQTEREVSLLRSALAQWHKGVVIVTIASGNSTPEMAMALKQHGTVVALSGAECLTPTAELDGLNGFLVLPINVGRTLKLG